MKELLIAALLVVALGTAGLVSAGSICKHCDDCKCKPTCSCPR